MSKNKEIKADRFFKNTGINLDSLKENLNLSNFEKNIIASKKIEMISILSLKDAPSDWNFFPKYNTSKMIEMVYSIRDNGLYMPIIVWEREEDEYTILAGHNRVNAYKILYKGDITRGIEEWQKGTFTYKGQINEKYKEIPAFVLSKEELQEDKAKELIIDTNYVARDSDRRIVPLIIKNRMEVRENLGRDKPPIKEIMDELGIKRTRIYEDFTLTTKIIDNLSNLYFEGLLDKKNTLRFSYISKDLQEYLYETYKGQISPGKVRLINKSTKTKKDVDNIFSEKSPKIKVLSLESEIPENMENKFRKDFNRWIKTWKKRNI